MSKHAVVAHTTETSDGDKCQFAKLRFRDGREWHLGRIATTDKDAENLNLWVGELKAGYRAEQQAKIDAAVKAERQAILQEINELDVSVQCQSTEYFRGFSAVAKIVEERMANDGRAGE